MNNDAKLRDTNLAGHRSRLALPVENIPLSKLIPSETVIEELEVHKIMTDLAEGKRIEPPRVSPINGFYYVRDGNHRVMAMKQIGHTQIACKIQAHKTSPNVANFDEDDCGKKIEQGYAGFEKVLLGTKEMKERAYAEEEEESLSDLLEPITEKH